MPDRKLSLRRRRTSEVIEELPMPRFICRTCNSDGPFYVAREVVNWTTIGDPHRKSDGSLTYRIYNSYLPGHPGPPVAYLCGNCRSATDTLEELVLEPAFVGEADQLHGGFFEDDQ